MKKPLLSVKELIKVGSIVQFGESEEDCFIMNVTTGDKVMMKKEGTGIVRD